MVTGLVGWPHQCTNSWSSNSLGLPILPIIIRLEAFLFALLCVSSSVVAFRAGMRRGLSTTEQYRILPPAQAVGADRRETGCLGGSNGAKRSGNFLMAL